MLVIKYKLHSEIENGSLKDCSTNGYVRLNVD